MIRPAYPEPGHTARRARMGAGDWSSAGAEMNEVTQILVRLQSGDPTAADQLLPLVYEELRKLAVVRMANEKAGQTLQPTALVHEAWLKIAGDGQEHFANRRHFFKAAATAMQQILIDNARRKQRRKRGGQRPPDVRGSDMLSVTMGSFDVLELDDVLSRFAVQYPKRAELVKLRYFAGFGLAEAADVLGISRATAHRHWAFAKAWLYRALCENDGAQVSNHATSFRAD